MPNYCEHCGGPLDTSVTCWACRAQEVVLSDSQQAEVERLRALLRECEEPLRLLAASQALRARIYEALEL